MYRCNQWVYSYQFSDCVYSSSFGKGMGRSCRWSVVVKLVWRTRDPDDGRSVLEYRLTGNLDSGHSGWKHGQNNWQSSSSEKKKTTTCNSYNSTAKNDRSEKYRRHKCILRPLPTPLSTNEWSYDSGGTTAPKSIVYFNSHFSYLGTWWVFSLEIK